MVYFASNTDKIINDEYNKHIDKRKNKILGEALYCCRKKLGNYYNRKINQDKFANMIGIGRNTLINIEINPSKPKTPYKHKLNKYTEKTIVDFLEQNYIEQSIYIDYYVESDNEIEKKQYERRFYFCLENQLETDTDCPSRLDINDYTFAITMNSIFLNKSPSWEATFAIETLNIGNYNLIRYFPSNDTRFAVNIGNKSLINLACEIRLAEYLTYDERLDIISDSSLKMLKNQYNISKHTITFYRDNLKLETLDYIDCLRIIHNNEANLQSLNNHIYSSLIKYS